MHRSWTPWHVVRLPNEVELPTWVDVRGLDMSREVMMAQFFRLGLADLANPVLVPRPAYWATLETVPVVAPALVEEHGVTVVEAFLVAIWVVAVVETG